MSSVNTDARNEVLLVGRVSADPEDRELPSGDVLTTFRLIVERPPPRRPTPPGGRPATTDTLDCVAWAGGVRRSARALRAGDVVAVEGALRRRFWQSPAGAASRYEIELDTVNRLRKAG